MSGYMHGKTDAFIEATDLVNSVVTNALDHKEMGILDANDLLMDLIKLNSEMVRLGINCLSSKEERDILLSELRPLDDLGKL